MTRIIRFAVPALVASSLSWSCVDQPLVALEHRPTSGAGGQSSSSQGGSVGRGGTSEQGLGGGGGSPSSTGPWSGGGGGFDCRPAESTCLRDTDCCPSLACREGVCTQRQCSPFGTGCGTNDDCCSGSCRTNGNTGLRACAFANGCGPIGEVCGRDDECCSTDCYRGKCSPTKACLMSGETHCERDDADECCNGTTCLATLEGIGVARCSPNPCVAEGAACSHDEACCSSVTRKLSCEWSGSVGGRICKACVRLGASCGAGVFCCGAAICSEGTCVLAPQPGTGGAGSTTQGTSAGICAGQGQSCATANCCSGLFCENATELCVPKL